MPGGDSARLIDAALRRELGVDDADAAPDASERNPTNTATIDAARRAMRDHRYELATLLCLQAAESAQDVDEALEEALSDAFLGVRCDCVVADAHPGGALTVAWSPDGAMALSGGADGKVALWAGDRLTPITRLDGHEDRVRRVEFNRIEPMFASCGDDGAVIVWDAAVHEMLWRADGDEASALAARFSPSGRRIAIAAAPAASGVRDAASGAVRFGFDKHDGVIVYDAVFSPDGRHVASCGDDGRAIVWDASSGAVVREIQHGRPVRSVAFDAAGRRVATASYDGSVIIADLAGGAAVERRSPRGRGYRVAFVGEHDALWVTGEVGAQRIIEHVGQADERDVALPEHDAHIHASCVAPNGERFASVGQDGTTHVMKLDGGEMEVTAVLRSAGGATLDVDLSWRGDRVATAGADGSLALWSLRDDVGTARRAAHGPALLRAARLWRRASGRAITRHECDQLGLDLDVSLSD